MRLKLIVLSSYFLWVIAGLILIGATLFFWLHTHHETCVSICQYLGNTQRLKEFENQFLTLVRFKIIRYGVSLLAFLYAFVSYFSVSKINVWAHGLNQFLSWFLQSLQGKYKLFSSTQQWLGLIVISSFFLMKFYHIGTVPISYDEAWTYLNFSSKSPLVTLSYYPAPNNHILFTLATNFSSLLPLPHAIALRLPNLLLLPIASIAFTFMLREWFSSAIALIGGSLLIASYPVQLYSLQARGYLLYMVLGAVAFYTIYKLMFLPVDKLNYYRWLFILISISGFYVMPSFLYVVFSCGVFSLLFMTITKEWGRLKVLVRSGLWIGIGIVIVYTPVFLASGWQAVFNNPYVQRYSYSVIFTSLAPHFRDTGNWLVGFLFPYGYSIILLIIASLIGFYFGAKSNRLLLLLTLTFLLCPFAILLIHKAIPFERTWSYTIFPVVTGVCYLLSQIRLSRPIQLVLALVCVSIVLVSTVLFMRKYPESYSRDYDAEAIAHVALEQSAHSFYIEQDYYEVLLYYYYTIAQQKYQVDNKQIGQVFNNQKNYDYLLVERSTAAYGNKYQSTDYGRLIKVLVKK